MNMAYNHLTDSELVWLLIHEDDSNCFGELYVRYRKKLLLYCLTFVKLPDIAEDIVQDVFTAVWKGRHGLNPEMSFSSYLYTITRNRTLNFLRQVNTDRKLKEKLLKAGKPEPGTIEMPILDKEYKILLDNAVAQLSPLRQNIFKLSREQHKSHNEIARLLRISPYTVQENISASLKQIKTYLNRHTGMHFSFWTIFLAMIHLFRNNLL
ncbi:MAG: RNA polymerase sigma-70 factor [Mangrovibacterium sp.]